MTCVWWPGMGVFCMPLLRVKFCGKYIGEAWSLLWNGRSLSSEGIKLTRFCDQCGTVGSDVGVPTCTLWCIELPSAQFLPDARIVKPLGVCCNSKLPPALIDVLACAPAMEQAIPVNMLRREVCACLFCYSECLRFQGYPYHIGHPYPSVGLRAFWERE